jgi:hypothetical protein
MNADDICKDKMNKLFTVTSDFKLYETYTETWAVILNTCFCAHYYLLESKSTLDQFLYAVKFFMGYEVLFKVFQMNKILSFMGLDYSMITSQKQDISSSVKTLYKEDTNVFAYHIATTILLCNYTQFLSWCNENTLASSPIVFKKTVANIESFCELITKTHNSKITEKIIGNKCYARLMENIDDTNEWIRSTMRMTICEMA